MVQMGFEKMKKVISLTSKLSEGLIQLGYRQINKTYFDTILINVGNVSMENINTYAEDKNEF